MVAWHGLNSAKGKKMAAINASTLSDHTMKGGTISLAIPTNTQSIMKASTSLRLDQRGTAIGQKDKGSAIQNQVILNFTYHCRVGNCSGTPNLGSHELKKDMVDMPASCYIAYLHDSLLQGENWLDGQGRLSSLIKQATLL